MLCGNNSILRKVCWETSRFSLYLSDLLPAHLPGRWPDDGGVLACRIGAVHLPAGQRILELFILRQPTNMVPPELLLPKS